MTEELSHNGRAQVGVLHDVQVGLEVFWLPKRCMPEGLEARGDVARDPHRLGKVRCVCDPVAEPRELVEGIIGALAGRGVVHRVDHRGDGEDADAAPPGLEEAAIREFASATVRHASDIGELFGDVRQPRIGCPARSDVELVVLRRIVVAQRAQNLPAAAQPAEGLREALANVADDTRDILIRLRQLLLLVADEIASEEGELRARSNNLRRLQRALEQPQRRVAQNHAEGAPFRHVGPEPLRGPRAAAATDGGVIEKLPGDPVEGVDVGVGQPHEKTPIQLLANLLRPLLRNRPQPAKARGVPGTGGHRRGAIDKPDHEP
mmetsp:Transcript_127889/g.368377  ORF Transcript_127889/g.368377 Transcript_127889/m.368377 type:complete len:320 (-) Transcript_127889:152-1111(-)